MMRCGPIITIAGCALLCSAAAHADASEKDTIKSLEKETVEIRPGQVGTVHDDPARANFDRLLLEALDRVLFPDVRVGGGRAKQRAAGDGDYRRAVHHLTAASVTVAARS